MTRRHLSLLFSSALLLSSCAYEVTEQDWPQFKKDNFRSGVTVADIDLKNFGSLWVYDTKQEPVPAWYGPAKEDAYVYSGPLPSMRDYDLSYYPIVVKDKLYYASSADDAVHCHNISTGEEIWVFTTGAPIRIAPTYYNGNIYVGSDDGFAYCLDADDGDLNWKFSPTDSEEKILNNGRFISKAPIRTGVMIENGKAFFGASLLPWEKSTVCAVDAESGEVGEKGTFIKEYEGQRMTLEGAMASTGKVLIQPQGRIAPVFFNRESGESLGTLSGTGGCFVLVTPEKSVIHGKTSRYISMYETTLDEEKPKVAEENEEHLQMKKETDKPQSYKQVELMSYNDGKEIAVKGDTSFVLCDRNLSSYNRKTKKLLWLNRSIKAHRMIVAGDYLFIGTADKIQAISCANGRCVWEAKVRGTVYALIFAQHRLFASTSEGYIYSFGDGGKDFHYYPENLTKPALADKLKKEEKPKYPNELMADIIHGPYVQAISSDTVLLSFETKKDLAVHIDWEAKGLDTYHVTSPKGKNHLLKMPVRKGFFYIYGFQSEEGLEASFEYDNFFNMYERERMQIPDAPKKVADRVDEALSELHFQKGLCLVMGDRSGDFALALAKRLDMNVVNLLEDESDYEDFLEDMQEAEVYGRKISALKVSDENQLPIISEIADLVWVDEADDFCPDEVIRLIAPQQYAVLLGMSPDEVKQWLAESTLDWQVDVVSSTDRYTILKKHEVENIGVWSHQYGDMRNASYGGESLYGNNSSTDFKAQWMGRPGARFLTDRSGRKPSPLVINGRMFVQGKEKILSQSIYNGSIYWVKDIPGLNRMNIARDCSNWAADNEYIYVAKDGFLLKIEQLTGNIVMSIQVPNRTDSVNWAYIGVMDNQLVGSVSRPTAQFHKFHGGGNEGWYDAQEGPNSYKVLSNELFAVTKEGEWKWTHTPHGQIINTTICEYEGKLLFVESLSANRQSAVSGKGGDDLYERTRLVALDVYTGEKLYEQPFSTIAGKTVYFMAVNSGKCVIVSSADWKYDIQAFEVATGKPAWKTEQKWFHNNHGAHMSKPAIAGDRLIVKPAIYNVHTGERLAYNTPKVGHGCASYALSDEAMFYRGGSCAMFNFETRSFSIWDRLRPDCWISTIPAQGMLISPEAAGGCSCGLWYETSMVFAPISRTPILIKGHTKTSKKDYMDETWGKFAKECRFNEFTDSLEVELILKPGLDHTVYYTTDGSEPTKESAIYRDKFMLTESCTVKAAVFIKKGDRQRRFVRSQYFQKVSNVKNVEQ